MTTRAGVERLKREAAERGEATKTAPEPNAGDTGTHHYVVSPDGGGASGPFAFSGEPQPCDRHVRVAVHRITGWIGRMLEADELLDDHRDELVRILRDFAAVCFVDGGVDAITKTTARRTVDSPGSPT